MSTQTQQMSIRVTKCKFGPMIARYHSGMFHDVEQHEYCKRGVVAGLDNSHSKDFKVSYVSDPLLVIHSDGDTLHSELSSKLKELNLWNDQLHKVDLPRTARNGSMSWAAGFKTLPRESGRFDHYKHKLKEANKGDFGVLESENSIEVTA